ncbi:retrovirus-related pol polyprotein from transposon TNT 1-94 [Tanacetum coccineum]
MYNNKEGAIMGTEVVGSSLKSNDDSISGNKEDASSIAAKTHDNERKMLEGKLVLVGDDGVLVKPLCESSTVLDFGLMSHIAISIDHHVENVEHVNVDGQASAKHSSDVSPKTRKGVNFRTLLALADSGVDVAISLDSIRIVHERFSNSVYEFFLGKRVEHPFSSKDGMDTMLENDSWLIRNVLLTLEKWSSNANLMKEGVCNVLIRVKFYDVPITAFTEDGLSVIATKLAGGGANDASLLEDEDYDIYDDYEIDVYDLSEEQLPFCDAYGIRLRGRVRK